MKISEFKLVYVLVAVFVVGILAYAIAHRTRKGVWKGLLRKKPKKPESSIDMNGRNKPLPVTASPDLETVGRPQTAI